MQEWIILWQNSKGAFVMKQLKKLVIAGALGVLTLALAGCGGGDKKAENAKPDTSWRTSCQKSKRVEKVKSYDES